MQAGNLVITNPNGPEQRLELGEGAVYVGSAPNCDLVLVGSDIAPHHATIVCDERGRLVVEICGENFVGQGGMRLTFNLSQIARRRELAWIGNYVLSYQPATWECQTQPLRLADASASDRAVGGAAPTAQRSTDETSLLHTLLGQSLAGHSHEAATLAMPLMALAACDA
jgi:Inner membrane component of T3SS, cytoplasmic domain